jgi:hypothetical protein
MPPKLRAAILALLLLVELAVLVLALGAHLAGIRGLPWYAPDGRLHLVVLFIVAPSLLLLAVGLRVVGNRGGVAPVNWRLPTVAAFVLSVAVMLDETQTWRVPAAAFCAVVLVWTAVRGVGAVQGVWRRSH